MSYLILMGFIAGIYFVSKFLHFIVDTIKGNNHKNTTINSTKKSSTGNNHNSYSNQSTHSNNKSTYSSSYNQNSYNNSSSNSYTNNQKSNSTNYNANNTYSERLNKAYTLLGVTKGVSIDDLKNAKRRLLNQWHPDRAPVHLLEQYTKKSQEINDAYDLILNDINKPKTTQQTSSSVNNSYPANLDKIIANYENYITTRNISNHYDVTRLDLLHYILGYIIHNRLTEDVRILGHWSISEQTLRSTLITAILLNIGIAYELDGIKLAQSKIENEAYYLCTATMAGMIEVSTNTLQMHLSNLSSYMNYALFATQNQLLYRLIFTYYEILFNHPIPQTRENSEALNMFLSISGFNRYDIVCDFYYNNTPWFNRTPPAN